jgi:hypothetical protein
MDKELKEKWVKALRSGEYKQGTGVLKSLDGEYCCLGVLCEVGKLGAWEQTNTPDLDGYKFLPEHGTDYMYGELPAETLEAIDLSYSTQQYLIYLNDEEGNNFNEIADYIERVL